MAEPLFDVITIREGQKRTVEKNLTKQEAKDKADEWQKLLSDAYIVEVVVKIVPAQG